MDLALNNLQRLVCHKIQPTSQPTNQPPIDTYVFIYPAKILFTLNGLYGSIWEVLG